ncbi:hypothetical protein QMK33_18425 [Hymenobacter sp. H14-R3]|uniref:hypothetical protein n=1 Tax=Hymenobacter sp. H14-R3 TaxID=3046308 RepID=UPI0024B881EE|nr:hypothetical protein [Hymenobacter sp. H14-R3]MDJ0367131.1 hypothetical protein [Hymenobacter sp. H14-R3]
MKRLHKIRRLLAVMLLCTGLFGLASVNNTALGASTQGTAPTGSSETMVVAAWGYNIGYFFGVIAAAAGICSPQVETANMSTDQLAAARYQAADFSSFDK